MKSKLRIFLSLLPILGTLNTSADCIDTVRAELFQRAISKNLISTDQNIDDFIFNRIKTFKNLARAEIGHKVQDSSLNGLKRSFSSEKLLETISLEKLPKDINQLLTRYWSNHNSIEFQARWLKGLLKAVIYRTYNSGSIKQIEKLERDETVPEKALVDTILNRLISTGLNTGNPERVWLSLSPSNFGELLLDRKVIIDETFRGRDHGHLIHLMQMDMLRVTAKETNISQKVVGDLIEFIGRDKSIAVDDFVFRPLEDIWDVLFDSTEKDFSRPEILNIPIETALGWRAD